MLTGRIAAFGIRRLPKTLFEVRKVCADFAVQSCSLSGLVHYRAQCRLQNELLNCLFI